MKTILAIAAAIAIALSTATPAAAQTWVSGNQVTLSWDAVAPIEPTDVITYQVYLKPSLTGTPAAFGATIAGTQQLVQFSSEGRYFLCVETLRLPQGETEPIRSERMACSDVAADTEANDPFGCKYFAPPASAGGLRGAP